VQWADVNDMPEECNPIFWNSDGTEPGSYQRVPDECCSGATPIAPLTDLWPENDNCFVFDPVGDRSFIYGTWAGGCSDDGQFFYGEKCGGSDFGDWAEAAYGQCSQPEELCSCIGYVETFEAGCFSIATIIPPPGPVQDAVFLQVDGCIIPEPDTTELNMATYIGVEEAYEMWKNGEFDMIIDVRAFEDRGNNLGYSTYHIPGSTNVPELGFDLADNQDWASMRDDSCKDMSVLVVCYGGLLSFGATDYLIENGWTNIYTAPQDEWGVQYGGWVDAGYETESGEGSSELPCDDDEEGMAPYGQYYVYDRATDDIPSECLPEAAENQDLTQSTFSNVMVPDYCCDAEAASRSYDVDGANGQRFEDFYPETCRELSLYGFPVGGSLTCNGDDTFTYYEGCYSYGPGGVPLGLACDACYLPVVTSQSYGCYRAHDVEGQAWFIGVEKCDSPKTDERQITMTSLVSDSFSCMFEVLAMYDQNSQEYADLYNDFSNLYYKKNMGLWVTESDLEEAHTFCEEDAFSIGTDYCMSTMAMFSTAAVSYGDANYKEAVDAIQDIHDAHGVCPMWGPDHYTIAMPTADFDCTLLEPVDDNSDEYPERANVVGACQRCVRSNCLESEATEEPSDDGCDCDMSGYVAMEDFDALRAEVRELQGSLGSVEADNNDVMNAMEEMATCMSGIVDGFSGEEYDTEEPMTEAPETTRMRSTTTTTTTTTTMEPTKMPSLYPTMRMTEKWETMARMAEGPNKCGTASDERAFRLTFTSLDNCVDRCYGDSRCNFASTDMDSWCIGCIVVDKTSDGWTAYEMMRGRRQLSEVEALRRENAALKAELARVRRN